MTKPKLKSEVAYNCGCQLATTDHMRRDALVHMHRRALVREARTWDMAVTQGLRSSLTKPCRTCLFDLDDVTRACRPVPPLPDNDPIHRSPTESSPSAGEAEALRR
jgi:hypothetical protein